MSDKRAKIFLSYSITKSPAPKGVAGFIEFLKEQLEKHYIVLDPMVEKGTAGVREKVLTALNSADAIFAEVSVPAPNILFEVGFGTARALPVVFFVDRSLPSVASPDWKTYFELFKQDKDRPLPADLGDAEYFSYSTDDLLSQVERQKLAERLKDGVFQKLNQGALAPGCLAFRRSQFALDHEVRSLIQPELDLDHPLFFHIAGWLAQISQEFKADGASVFEFEARYYKACLSAFSTYDKRSVIAIADLSKDTELDLWMKHPDPLQTAVKERIFLLNWSVLFDTQRWASVGATMLEQKERGEYQVRVGILKPDSKQNLSHFGPNTVGYNLLLVEPDLVGGYVRKDSRELLRIERNHGKWLDAQQTYEQVRQKTVDYQNDWGISDLRRALLESQKIGQWNGDWGFVAERDPSYFDNYDMHIRCWIPRYEELLRDCLLVVQDAIMELWHSGKDRMKILEVGYGTGALTLPMLEWIQERNTQARVLQRPEPVKLYLGLDAAKRMQQIASQRTGGARSIGSFEFDLNVGSAWYNLDPRMVKRGPYDVVFGSLVLHDIVGEKNQALIEELFRECARLLTPGGFVIFADAFVDPNNRASQIEAWKNWMVLHELTQKAVDAFFDKNPEMVNTVTLGELKEVASRHGFVCQEIKLQRLNAQTPIPFGVLVMQKVESNRA